MSEAFKMAIAGAVGGGMSGIMGGPVGMLVGTTVGFVGGLGSHYYFKDKQADLSALEEKLTIWKISENSDPSQRDEKEKRVEVTDPEGRVPASGCGLTGSEAAREDAVRRLSEGLGKNPQLGAQMNRKGNTYAHSLYSREAIAQKLADAKTVSRGGELKTPVTKHLGIYPQISEDLSNDLQQVDTRSGCLKTAVPAV